jgi:ribosomal peptide maturation radical SAM protein 1
VSCPSGFLASDCASNAGDGLAAETVFLYDTSRASAFFSQKTLESSPQAGAGYGLIGKSSMLNVALINMPFARVHAPSLALLQLQGMLRRYYPQQVETRIHYLNNDFAHFLGPRSYYELGHFPTHLYTGLGDWWFRQLAFPDTEDNAEAYFARFYGSAVNGSADVRAFMLQKREELEAFLEHLIDLYRLDGADIVGFTSMFTQNLACLALARLLKARRPEMVAVMGGANCEAPMGHVLAAHAPQIDYVFSGPALQSFADFVGCQLRGDTRACKQIDGVLSGAAADPGAATSALGAEVDINTSMPLDYAHFLHTFRAAFPEARDKPYLTFETSRGCWWGESAHCTFCGLNGQTMRFRFMRPDKVRAQFERLFAHHGECSAFVCVDNIMPKAYLTEVFPTLRPPDDVLIFYEVKSDLTFAELGMLARANVRAMQAGIESLATSTLRLMRKGSSALNNIRFLRDCKTHAIRPSWNLLIGFPGETADVYERYLEVIPRLAHLSPPMGVMPVRFDRYSPYFTAAEHYGLHLRPYDYYAFLYPFDQDSIDDLAYFFTDHNFTADYATAAARWLGPLESAVQSWLAPWQRRRPPQLHFVGESASGTIYDSRSGAAKEFEVGEDGRQLLKRCALPQSLSTLRASCRAGKVREMDATLELLRTHDLVFEEGGRIVSLVLPHAPRPPGR